MEENRLKVMDSYDSTLFNSMYERTQGLKHKLASGIDCRRFGVDREEVLSWFDVKLLFVFQKHHKNLDENALLGMIIKSLQFFKCRILRKAYTVKFSQNITPYESDLHEAPEEDSELSNYYSSLLRDFMLRTLSPDAYLIWDLQMCPPPYILRKLKKKGIDSIHNIPDRIILRYLDLKLCPNSYRFLELLKKEIKEAIKLAKVHFASN
jgi:hypothetical protein